MARDGKAGQGEPGKGTAWVVSVTKKADRVAALPAKKTGHLVRERTRPRLRREVYT